MNVIVKQKRLAREPRREDFQKNNNVHAVSKTGGATQSRTGLTGFAIRGITALLSRRADQYNHVH
jgi:hypothetical protein